MKRKRIKVIDNEPFSAFSHLIGLGLSIVALVLMVLFAAREGGRGLITGMAIFGASLILLYLASSLFHFWPKDHPRKKTLQRVDQAAIFILIAGTYTPLCLAMTHRGWGWTLFGIVWGLAIPAAILKLLGLLKSKKISTWLYLSMGWLLLIALAPILNWLPIRGVYWLFGGGLLYTIGAIFYALEYKLNHFKWLTAHDIFHLLVLGGSFSHFWLMSQYVVLSV